jgi:hypothetical protein
MEGSRQPKAFGKQRKLNVGTEGRNRTDTPSREPDFESGASTSSATPAFSFQEGRNHIVFQAI